jgi:hypothetical protein
VLLCEMMQCQHHKNKREKTKADQKLFVPGISTRYTPRNPMVAVSVPGVGVDT